MKSFGDYIDVHYFVFENLNDFAELKWTKTDLPVTAPRFVIAKNRHGPSAAPIQLELWDEWQEWLKKVGSWYVLLVGRPNRLVQEYQAPFMFGISGNEYENLKLIPLTDCPLCHVMNGMDIFQLRREVAQPGRVPASGVGSRRFKSCFPDQS